MIQSIIERAKERFIKEFVNGADYVECESKYVQDFLETEIRAAVRETLGKVKYTDAEMEDEYNGILGLGFKVCRNDMRRMLNHKINEILNEKE